MDKAYFAANDFSRSLEAIGIGAATLTRTEWALLRRGLSAYYQLKE